MALAAPGDPLHDGSLERDRALAARHVERTCRTAANGRRAARVLARWCQRLALSEADLQVLWSLRRTATENCDQSTLAGRLALSPAQVSATVERLRTKGCIEQLPSPADRRRNLWKLTSDGQRVLEELLIGVASLFQRPPVAGRLDIDILDDRRESAA